MNVRLSTWDPAKYCFAVLFFICTFALPYQMRSQSRLNEKGTEHLKKGDAAMKAGHLDEANIEYAAALAIAPSSPEVNERVSLVQVMRGDCRGAIERLREVVKLNSVSATAKGLIGICERREGTASAQVDLEAGFVGIEDPQVRSLVGVELAQYYYDRGDLEHTVPVVQALIALNPENTDLLFFAQHVYQDLADETLNKLTLIAPDSPRVQQAIAEHLVNNGDLPGAIDHYRKALASDPYLPGANFELGEAILATGHDPNSLQQARNEFEKSIEIDGEGPRVETALARIFEIEGNTDEALAKYRRALAMNSADTEARLGVARLLLRNDKPAEAIPYLRGVLDADPLNADARYQLASALKATGKTEEGKEQLRIFQEVRTNKDKMIQVYRQMNKRPVEGQDGADSDRPR